MSTAGPQVVTFSPIHLKLPVSGLLFLVSSVMYLFTELNSIAGVRFPFVTFISGASVVPHSITGNKVTDMLNKPRVSDEFMNWCEQRGIEVVDSAGKAKERQGKVEHYAQLFELMLEDDLADVHAQTEYEWRECLDALQEAKNSLLSVSCLSPMQLVFGRNPEIPGDLLSDNPDLIASSSLLHDRVAGQAARVRTVARTNLMLHSDKLNARRALDTRPRVVPTFLLGDMVAVWRLMKGCGIHPPGLPIPHETSSALVLDSGVPGSVGLGDEDMTELVPVLLAQRKKTRELDLEEPRWQTKEDKHLVAEGYRKEMNSLVEDTKAWIPVSLEKSRLLRSSVPDRILQPRPVLTLRTKDDGTQEVKCRCTLQGLKDPDVLDLVRDRKTESPTLSTNSRAMILQLIASCRFVMTIGVVQAAFLLADREGRPKGPLYVTMPKSYVKEGTHPDQLFEVKGGYGLGDQPQQWWRTLERFLFEQLGFCQHPMDPCVFILRELSSHWNEMNDEVSVIPSGDVGPPGSLCGIVGVHVDDQINGGRGVRWVMR